jgi:HPt (histidine-containing phosphotransfer) domain-containing protein
LSGFGGRADLVTEVIDVFLADTPAMIARLRRAASESDAAEIAAAAHAIKGSAGLFSQGEAYEHARALEARARSGDATNALAACDEIDASLSRLTSELRGLRERFQKS